MKSTILGFFVLGFFCLRGFCLLYNLVKDGMGFFVFGGFVRWVLSRWFLSWGVLSGTRVELTPAKQALIVVESESWYAYHPLIPLRLSPSSEVHP